MTLAMDIRLAADVARFGFVFARRGIVPEACSSWFLPRVVGISRRTRMGVLRPRISRATKPSKERTRPQQCHPKDQLIADRARHRARDRRQHLGDLGDADPPDDVEDARRGSSDGGAQDSIRAASITPAVRRTRAKASRRFSKNGQRDFPAKCRRIYRSSSRGGKPGSSTSIEPCLATESTAWPHPEIAQKSPYAVDVKAGKQVLGGARAERARPAVLRWFPQGSEFTPVSSTRQGPDAVLLRLQTHGEAFRSATAPTTNCDR